MLGILGGTFDPIHYGHLRSALDVQQALGLEQLRFIPLRRPPHREPPRLEAERRAELVELAVADQPGFVLDRRELAREGISYTVDTLASLRQELGDAVPICLLLGLDAFAGFPTWHRPERILELAHLVIMHRPDAVLPDEPYLRRLLAARRRGDPAALRANPAGDLHLVKVTQLEISSTAIRSLLARGLSPRFLLPDSVLARIRAAAFYAGRG
jgi:nicotinate-nucleotide adenylyltransferase